MLISPRAVYVGSVRAALIAFRVEGRAARPRGDRRLCVRLQGLRPGRNPLAAIPGSAREELHL